MTSTAISRGPHYRRIHPEPAWAFPDLRELWAHRDLLVMLAQRDLKVRYKQTALGVVWVILQPLLAAGILTFVFSVVGRLEQQGEAPAFLFTFAGVIGFDVFRRALDRSSGSLVANAGLVSKVYFPRLIIPIASVGSTLVDFAVALALMLVMLAMAGVWPGAWLLLLPVPLAVMAGLGLGIGFIGSAISVRFRDVGHVLPVASRLVFYATPVAYAASAVPLEYEGMPVRALYYLNPMAAPVEATKLALVGQGDVAWAFFAYAAGCAVVVMAVGAVIFGRMERGFADVV